ncbi:EAL domain-containing protein [Bosea sp. TWI1241]|uniref:putative bifunctional diguanylate cyclase/phosphodiesterase n=1 Tax=Bosea sp. TWI1241 TaxID=3148904 RepID=UPI003208F0FB
MGRGRTGATETLAQAVGPEAACHEAILASLQTAVFVVDSEGRLTYFNAVAERLGGTKLTLGEKRWWIGRRVMRLDGSPIAADDLPTVIVLRERRAVRGPELLMEEHGGSVVPVMPFLTPLFGADGAVTGVVNLVFDMRDSSEARVTLEAETRSLLFDLEAALSAGELRLHYQPLFDASGALLGFEALARWRHDERGDVAPSDFIAAAEAGGLILPLAEHLLRLACAEAARWTKPLRVAVNISPLQFRHGDLPGLIETVLAETGLAPERLELEITEGVMITDFDRAMTVLHRIKALGVRIALDDFGTGYSSLSYLHVFPLSTLKIDRSFVANLGVVSEAAAIARAVISLGHALGIEVVAEGVERREQFDFLAEEGCNVMQGFFLGRPQPAEGYADLMGRRPD